MSVRRLRVRYACQLGLEIQTFAVCLNIGILLQSRIIHISPISIDFNVLPVVSRQISEKFLPQFLSQLDLVVSHPGFDWDIVCLSK